MKNCDVAAAEGWIRIMEEDGMSPNAETYYHMTRIHIAMGNDQEVERYTDMMLPNTLDAKTDDADTDTPVVQLLETIVFQCINRNMPKTAVSVIGKLCLSDPSPPNPKSRLAKLMNALARKGDVGGTTLIRNAMISLGLNLHDDIFSQMALAYAASGDIEASLNHMASVLSRGHALRLDTVIDITRATWRSQPLQLRRLLKFLKKGKTRLSLKALKIIEEAFRLQGDIEGLQMVLDEALMLDASSDPSLHEFIIMTALQVGDWDSMKCAYEKLSAAKRITQVAYEPMLLGSIATGDWNRALSLLKSISRIPSQSTRLLLAWGLQKSTSKLLHASNWPKFHKFFALAKASSCANGEFEVTLSGSTSILKFLTNKDLLAALQPYREMKVCGALPTPHALNSLIIASCSAGEIDIAIEVLQDAVRVREAVENGPFTVIEARYQDERRGSIISQASVDQLSRICINSGDSRRLSVVLELLKQLGMYPQNLILLISAFLEKESLNEALGVIDDGLKTRHYDRSYILAAINKILKFCVPNPRFWPYIEACKRAIESANVVPDERTYQLLIQHAASTTHGENDVEEFRKKVAGLKRAESTSAPSNKTHLANKSEEVELYTANNDWTKQQSDAFNCTALDYLVRKRDYKGFYKSLMRIQEGQQEAWSPKLYSSAIYGLSRWGMPSLAMKYLLEMRTAGIKPDAGIYAALLSCFAAADQPNGFMDCVKMLRADCCAMTPPLSRVLVKYMALSDSLGSDFVETLKELNVPLNPMTCLTLMEGFAVRGDVKALERARRISEEMGDFRVSEAFFVSIVRCYCRAAVPNRVAESIAEMKNAGFGQLPPMTMADMIALATTIGDRQRALDELANLQSTYPPTFKPLNHFVRQTQSLQSLAFVGDLIATAFSHDVLTGAKKTGWVNAAVCNRLLNAHLKRNDLPTYIKLFKTFFVSSHLTPTPSSWTDYMVYLCQSRRHRDAISVWQALRSNDESKLSPAVIDDLSSDNIHRIFPRGSSLFPWRCATSVPAVLTACGLGGLIDDAKRIWDELKNEGYPVTETHTRSFLECLGRNGEWDEALRAALDSKSGLETFLTLEKLLTEVRGFERIKEAISAKVEELKGRVI
ncbi:hypothetical protein HDU67_008740 [Dinochytrium kinnereticum]|nr:hypothetical protein HDU67_008740 [Dinochytrium kinnereticum]